MGYKIIKCYREELPKSCFVGKCFKNSDRVNGDFNSCWSRWHAENRFAPLEALLTDEFKAAYPEAEAYVGLMKNRYGADDDYFEYWIGMFLPADTEIPDGYDKIDMTHHDFAGICWIQGPEYDVFFHEGECWQALINNGFTVPSEEDGGCYMFERYVCPRFTTEDENGMVTLDLGYFVD